MLSAGAEIDQHAGQVAGAAAEIETAARERPRLQGDRLEDRLEPSHRWDLKTDRRSTCLRRRDTESQAPPDRSRVRPQLRFRLRATLRRTRRSLRRGGWRGRRVSSSRNASPRVSSSPRSVKRAASPWPASSKCMASRVRSSAIITGIPSTTGNAQHSQPSTPDSMRSPARTRASFSTSDTRVPQNGQRSSSSIVSCMAIRVEERIDAGESEGGKRSAR